MNKNNHAVETSYLILWHSCFQLKFNISDSLSGTERASLHWTRVYPAPYGAIGGFGYVEIVVNKTGRGMRTGAFRHPGPDGDR
jgi:hypothetical protein